MSFGISWHVEKSPSDVPWSRGRRKCVSHPCGIWPPSSEISASNWQACCQIFLPGSCRFSCDFGLSFLHVAQIHRNLWASREVCPMKGFFAAPGCLLWLGTKHGMNGDVKSHAKNRVKPGTASTRHTLWLTGPQLARKGT